MMVVHLERFSDWMNLHSIDFEPVVSQTGWKFVLMEWTVKLYWYWYWHWHTIAFLCESFFFFLWESCHWPPPSSYSIGRDVNHSILGHTQYAKESTIQYYTMLRSKHLDDVWPWDNTIFLCESFSFFCARHRHIWNVFIGHDSESLQCRILFHIHIK